MGMRREDNDGECFALVEFKERGDQQLPWTRSTEFPFGGIGNSMEMQWNSSRRCNLHRSDFYLKNGGGFPFGRWISAIYKKVKPFKTYKTLWYIIYSPIFQVISVKVFLYKILETKKTEMCGESPFGSAPWRKPWFWGTQQSIYLQLGRLRPGGQATATWWIYWWKVGGFRNPWWIHLGWLVGGSSKLTSWGKGLSVYPIIYDIYVRFFAFFVTSQVVSRISEPWTAAPGKGWLEYDCFLLGRLFSGAMLVSRRVIYNIARENKRSCRDKTMR